MLAVVCDSSPLIYLSKLGRFGLLQHIYDAVLVPPAVWREVAVGGAGLPEAENLHAAVEAGWIQLSTPAPQPALSFPEGMGGGEIEAILLAREREAVLVTDDELARSFADSLGLEVTGTVGVLIRAKKTGRISSVKELLVQLKKSTTFRMSQQLYREALRIAQETE